VRPARAAPGGSTLELQGLTIIAEIRNIGSTRDLPFVEQSPRELLGIVPGRIAVDADFEGFGWGRFARLRLEAVGGECEHSASQGVVTTELLDVIVVALHVADEDASGTGDLDLELRVDDEALVVSLTTFLATWAPRLPTAQAWVLALCNPTEKPIARPASMPEGVALWVATGDVDAWAEGSFDAQICGLTATSWKCL